MFLLQSVTTWHNFMLFNDEFAMIELSLGAPWDDVFVPENDGYAVRWRPIQGWLYTDTGCGQLCGVLRGILRGYLVVTWGLTVSTVMQHVFALSGGPVLLIIRHVH